MVLLVCRCQCKKCLSSGTIAAPQHSRKRNEISCGLLVFAKTGQTSTCHAKWNASQRFRHSPPLSAPDPTQGAIFDRSGYNNVVPIDYTNI